MIPGNQKQRESREDTQSYAQNRSRDPPEQSFEALITPSAICQWWRAKTAIVLAKSGRFCDAVYDYAQRFRVDRPGATGWIPNRPRRGRFSRGLRKGLARYVRGFAGVSGQVGNAWKLQACHGCMHLKFTSGLHASACRTEAGYSYSESELGRYPTGRRIN